MDIEPIVGSVMDMEPKLYAYLEPGPGIHSRLCGSGPHNSLQMSVQQGLYIVRKQYPPRPLAVFPLINHSDLYFTDLIYIFHLYLFYRSFSFSLSIIFSLFSTLFHIFASKRHRPMATTPPPPTLGKARFSI